MIFHAAVLLYANFAIVLALLLVSQRSPVCVVAVTVLFLTFLLLPNLLPKQEARRATCFITRPKQKARRATCFTTRFRCNDSSDDNGGE